MALTDIWWGPVWYFFGLRWQHAVSSDAQSGPQQMPRYPNWPDRL